MRKLILLLVIMLGVCYCTERTFAVICEENPKEQFPFKYQYDEKVHDAALQYTKEHIPIDSNCKWSCRSKSYKVQDDVSLFKNILIGVWDGGISWYEFRKNGQLTIWHNVNHEYFFNNPNPPKLIVTVKKGTWEVNGDTLLFKIDGEKDIKKWTIKHYYVVYDKDDVRCKYTILIKAKEDIYLGYNLRRSFN